MVRMRSTGGARVVASIGMIVCLAVGCERRDRQAAPSAGEPGTTPGAWQLAFEQEIEGNVDIYLVGATGGPPRRITRDLAYDCHARWMPDGKRIVFTSDRSGTPQIWEMTADGDQLRRVRRNEAEESQPDPSPDGRSLAFLSDLDGPQGLLVMNLATGTATVLVRHGTRAIFGNPHWSPDSSRIAFSSNQAKRHQIYLVDAATGDAAPLVDGCEPRFDREGRAVAYVKRGSRPTSQLVEHDLETGEERILVDWPGFSYDLAYSPDGTEVAFASNIGGEFAIYRQRLSDGQAWRVTFGGGAARYPDYRPAFPAD